MRRHSDTRCRESQRGSKRHLYEVILDLIDVALPFALCIWLIIASRLFHFCCQCVSPMICCCDLWTKWKMLDFQFAIAISANSHKHFYESFQYNSLDTSLLSRFIMHPFWNWCVQVDSIELWIIHVQRSYVNHEFSRSFFLVGWHPIWLRLLDSCWQFWISFSSDSTIMISPQPIALEIKSYPIGFG